VRRVLLSLGIVSLLASVAPVLAAFGTRDVRPQTPEALPPVYFGGGRDATAATRRMGPERAPAVAPR